MKDELLKRARQCSALGMVFQGDTYINKDFNIHWTELTCDNQEEWDKKIAAIKKEMERRDDR